MGSREFTTWLAYSLLEPFGSFNDWQQTAQITQQIDRAYLGKGETSYLHEFMPTCFKPDRKPIHPATKHYFNLLKSGVKITDNRPKKDKPAP